jgi:hypothetical protein
LLVSFPQASPPFFFFFLSLFFILIPYLPKTPTGALQRKILISHRVCLFPCLNSILLVYFLLPFVLVFALLFPVAVTVILRRLSDS